MILFFGNPADTIFAVETETTLPPDDRAKLSWLFADPTFAEVDVDTLLSAAYADKLRGQIDMGRARSPMPDPDLVRHEDTVYITVVDAQGNACSFINTLFSNFMGIELAMQRDLK